MITEQSRDVEQIVQIERRSNARYPLHLRLRYQTQSHVDHLAGVGETVNISRGGMLVASQHELWPGARLAMLLEPYKLNGTKPVQLVVGATVVRCTKSFFASAFSRYRFRVQSVFDVMEPSGVPKNEGRAATSVYCFLRELMATSNIPRKAS